MWRIQLNLNEEREVVTQSGETLVLEGIVGGDLSLRESDGPLGIREYEYASYCEVDFDFELRGRRYNHRSLLWCREFLFRDGESVLEDRSGFEPSLTFAQLFDGRQTLTYTLDTGECRKIRVKYMDTQFWLMPEPTTCCVKCRHYDSSDFAGYRTIFYHRSYEELLFRKAAKLLYDEDGNLEDFEPNGQDYVIVEER